MALTGLKPPGPLELNGDISMNWNKWIRSYEIYAGAAGVASKPEKVQCNVFLHVAGLDAQMIHSQFEIPDDELERITPLIERFRNYCLGKTNLTVVRYRFNSYRQMNESMDSYIAGLRARAANCEYGTLHDSLLRDRIICGVADDQLREKLLHTQELTLHLCITMCRLSEIRSTDVSTTNDEKIENEVNAIIRAGRNEKRGNPRNTWRQSTPNTTGGSECGWCGYNHPRDRDSCPAKGKECNHCKKIGHFSKVCRTRGTEVRPVNTLQIETTAETTNRSDQQNSAYGADLFVGTLNRDRPQGERLWYKAFMIAGTPVEFKLDTGSEANIIPQDIFDTLKQTNMSRPTCMIVTYTGQRIAPVGETWLTLCRQQLKFVITKQGSPILGKEACEQLQLLKRTDSMNIETNKMTPTPDGVTAAQIMVNKYADIFKGLGLIKTNAHIFTDKNVQSHIDPPRRIPHSIVDNVKNELDRMLELGVIAEQHEPTEWVSSITIVRKNNKLRICLDPTKLNNAICRGAYPVKTVEEVLTKLSGAQYFTVLDANSGYWQIELDPESSRLCTFNTPWGRYRYTRMPFGIKTAGDIFIQEMSKILEGLTGVEVITDDILIYGSTIEEHNNNLAAVLERAREKNLRLNPKKSVICKTKVTYVGHLITQKGVSPSPDRVQAIADMPTPTEKTAVQRFLGMLNYVQKFIANLSAKAQPLRILLNKDVAWHWGQEQEQAFNSLKTALTHAPVLAYFDKNTPVILQVDACQTGLGAALIQNGRPVAMASKALNQTQTNYAIIEKEMLAICFGATRFHDYLYGQNVTVQTDHKPLVSIMAKPVHKISTRMQRMRMRLQNYDLSLQYINGSKMYFADTLSRAHTTSLSPENIFDDQLSVAEVNTVTNDINRLIKESSEDTTLCKIKELITNGWPVNKNTLDTQTQTYFTYRDELTTDRELIFKANRIVIPKKLQQNILETLHETHAGIIKTQQLARDTVFWPGITNHIKHMVEQCPICQTHRNQIHSEPMTPHHIFDIPFYKVGVDLFEHENEHFLILVDYYTKYPEVVKLTETTSKQIVIALGEIYSRFGIPKYVVSDNGPQFNSREYKTFAQQYGFQIIHTSPQYPKSNGQIERFVQTIKQMLKKSNKQNNNISIALLNYRNTPLQNIQASPAQLLMGRRL